MKVFQFRVGPMENFGYLLVDEKSKLALAIDSGWEIEPFVKIAAQEGMRVKYVAATHRHYDHVKTIGRLAAHFGASTVAFQGSEVNPKMPVKDGDVLKLGESSVKVIHTPGHTEDSVCYYDGEHLFTGDTLFIEAWGRTDLKGGSPNELYASLHDVIMALPSSTVIYPGHDYGSVPFRTLAQEGRKNGAMKARTVDEFRSLVQD